MVNRYQLKGIFFTPREEEDKNRVGKREERKKEECRKGGEEEGKGQYMKEDEMEKVERGRERKGDVEVKGE